MLPLAKGYEPVGRSRISLIPLGKVYTYLIAFLLIFFTGKMEVLQRKIDSFDSQKSQFESQPFTVETQIQKPIATQTQTPKPDIVQTHSTEVVVPQTQAPKEQFPRGESEERIVPLNQRRKDNEIRYAAFGSSMTWGAQLEDRESQAYVWRLSPTAGNHGIRSSGPNYPAACTYSMLGDEEYDVIIMEFFTVANTGMMELAQRLRERFPDALLVILRLWDSPMLVNKDGMDLRTWATKEHNFGQDFIHKDDFREAFKEYGAENWHWQFEEEHHWWIDVHEDVARETGAYIIPMDCSMNAFGPGGYLDIGDRLLGPDSFHLSEEGHASISAKVKALVDRVGVPQKPRIGAYHSNDHCLNWFLTGEVGEGISFSNNGKVEKMPNTEKYALTFDGGQGEIIMQNPADEMMYLYIAYMTAGPHKKYPHVEAERPSGAKYMLDPIAKGYKQDVHISNLVFLGHVQPGATVVVKFKELEKAEWPFRIVQAVLTPKKDFGTSYGSMPDSGRVRGMIDK